MYKIDLSAPCTAHFIGIGGISMSGFAELLHDNGFVVRGSDMTPGKITKHLESLGIEVIYGQSRENITTDIDFVVYTAAIHPDNPEFQAAKEAGLPMLERAEMVGQIMKNYKNAIGIAGTHGKTTTTSMLSHVFLEAEKDPTISVGGILDAIKGNIRIGHSDNFITEACEYTNSFLKFSPTAEIILNIEEDHLDFFKDIDDIRHSFKRYTELLPDDGILVINGEIENVEEIISNLACNVAVFFIKGEKEDEIQKLIQKRGDITCYVAENISFDSNGYGVFDLLKNGEKIYEQLSLSVPGRHNISNALSVIAMSDFYGIDPDVVKVGIKSFKGTERRFELKGTFNGVTVIDDYAHHPTEIAATLSAAERYPHKKLWVVFQPHTYTRTKALLKDFAKTLSKADNIVLADIYAAREKNPGDISSENLKEEINKLGKEAWYYGSFDEIENFLKKNCSEGDLLITMGAGNVVDIGEDLIR